MPSLQVLRLRRFSGGVIDGNSAARQRKQARKLTALLLEAPSCPSVGVFGASSRLRVYSWTDCWLAAGLWRATAHRLTNPLLNRRRVLPLLNRKTTTLGQCPWVKWGRDQRNLTSQVIAVFRERSRYCGLHEITTEHLNYDRRTYWVCESRQFAPLTPGDST